MRYIGKYGLSIPYNQITIKNNVISLRPGILELDLVILFIEEVELGEMIVGIGP